MSDLWRPLVDLVAELPDAVGEPGAVRGGQEEGLSCPSPAWRRGVIPSAEAVCSSSTAWALIPAKPNALTPARLGVAASPWIQGRGEPISSSPALRE